MLNNIKENLKLNEATPSPIKFNTRNPGNLPIAEMITNVLILIFVKPAM